ncbi:MAG: glycosyltransferase family 2 protein [Thermoplasmata archaeon]
MPVADADILQEGRFPSLAHEQDGAVPEPITLGACRAALRGGGRIDHLVVDSPESREASPFRVSVVACAYNEAQNIEGFLLSVLRSLQRSFTLQEVICVVSGSTDGTDEIVRGWARRDARVRLIVQSDRIGKAAALSLGMSAARGEIIVVENADTVPLPESLERLVATFQDPRIQLACSHPVPVPPRPGWTGRIGKSLWEVHDLVSRRMPKAGEAFAIRAPPVMIPWNIEDDDTYVGICAGLRMGSSVYVPEAIILNRVPETAREYFRQRFRVNRNILQLWHRRRLRSSTWQARYVAPALLEAIRAHPDRLPGLLGLVVSETLIRVAALLASRFQRTSRETWPPIESTKVAILRTAPTGRPH